MGSAAFSLLFMAFGLAMLAYMFHAFFAHSFLTDSMLAGAFVFVGFQALRILQLAEFNQRPHLETVIHISNEFITILAMTLIIGFMGY